jgi:hypothetical protein
MPSIRRRASALPGQSKSARYKMIRAAERHCLHYRAWHAAVHTAIAIGWDLLDRFVGEGRLHARTRRPTVMGR